VVRLTRLFPHPLPDPPAASAEEEADSLETSMPSDLAAALRALIESGAGAPVEIPLPADKAARRAIHAAVRAASPLLESETTAASIKVSIISGKGAKRPRPGAWRGGTASAAQPPYLHFTLHKVNMDTTNAVAALAHAMGVRPRAFAFAGTKDKRAATTQRISLFRANPAQVSGAARSCRGLAVGDFEYASQPLHLGQLSGNEFVITIRDITSGGEGGEEDASHKKKVTEDALERWRNDGFFFISYFGLQRFGGTASLGGLQGWGGTAASLPSVRDNEAGGASSADDFSSPLRTHRIGRMMLSGDWIGALKLVLSPRPGGDVTVATICSSFLDGKDAADAAAGRLRSAGRRDCIEYAVLAHLAKLTPSSKEAPKDDGGDGKDAFNLPSNGSAMEALCTALPPSLRLMYVHAYQSYLWNTMASARVAAGREAGGRGLVPVEGDLVFADGGTSGAAEGGVDDLDGDAIASDDRFLEAANFPATEDPASATAPDAAASTDTTTAPSLLASATVPTATSATPAAQSSSGPLALPSVRALTREDIDSNRFTIRDVILPLPGTLVEFPSSCLWGSVAVADRMRADGIIMKSDEASSAPADAGAQAAAATAAVRGAFSARDRRPAFTGGYRRIVSQARNVSWMFIDYSGDDEDLFATDFERILGRERKMSAKVGTRVALQISLQLDKSVYATVALRDVFI
jgi:tRNA pseudouridine13 synthase